MRVYSIEAGMEVELPDVHTLEDLKKYGSVEITLGDCLQGPIMPAVSFHGVQYYGDIPVPTELELSAGEASASNMTVFSLFKGKGQPVRSCDHTFSYQDICIHCGKTAEQVVEAEGIIYRDNPLLALACDHSWRPYLGLTESYDYCTKCEEKRTNAST